MKLCPTCQHVWDDALLFCPIEATLLEPYDLVPRRHSHCSSCGARYEADEWPRVCAACGTVSYRNPIPVAVVLVPVDDGLLHVRRAVGPTAGRLALPGGYVNAGETWEQAATRELFEETGIAIDPRGIHPFRVVSAPDDTLLVFGLTAAIPGATLPPFVPNDEVSEYVVLRTPEELAFPIHTRVAREYFDARTSGGRSRE
jgi:ADP-ribose pyrophosphatase YjhB (NUDIX family)